MKTDHKVIIGVVLLTLIIIVGGTWLSSLQAGKDKDKDTSNKPLMGEKIADLGGQHVPDGTKVNYNSNPPTSGPHYVTPQPAGIYGTPPPDGNLVHSMEHGAVIIWYQPNLPQDKIDQLKKIYNSVAISKKIMVPRYSLDVPIALTSWTRLLKLQTIDEVQIKEFMKINEGHGTENAPI